MADPARQMKHNQYIVIFMSAVLLLGAVNAVMVTADEYDPGFYVWFKIALDAAMTGLLVVLLVAVARGADSGGPKGLALLAGLVGLAAGLVKLAARFSSEHGWWTGHFNYALG